MRLSLQIENVGGKPRQIEIKQLVDLGSIPRAGDKVYVLIDPKDPDNVVLSSTPYTSDNVQTKILESDGKTTDTVNLNGNMVNGYLALTPELRKKGKLGVATIVSVIPAGGRSSQITMDIDNIGQAAKRVIITQPVDGYPLTAGNRVYYMYDPENPEMMALAPSAMMGGMNLGTGTNRLDPLVLGPQLIKAGAKAGGTVISAQEVDLANPLLTQKGIVNGI